MIAGILHEGSGLGDQLFRYITVRTLAEKKGWDWGMQQAHNFKGYEFFKNFEISSGPTHFYPKEWTNWNETDTRKHGGVDVRSYDPEINFVEVNTIIDGSFEDDKYWRHNLANISEWLAVEPLTVPDDICVVGFRGGEYAGNPDLFLPASYYKEAGEMMLNHSPNIKFQIHTDDPHLAKNFFSEIWSWPDFEVVENEQISHSKHTNMGGNWRSMRYAKYAIIPNSAFFILPRILKHHEGSTAVTVAPRYWARHNTKLWARPACYYPEFMYI